MTRDVPYDESRAGARGTIERPRWALGWVHQFDLIRAADRVRYLSRWWIVNVPLLGGFAVHRMDGPDARDVLHDHPFGFVSLVLRGGYVEQRLDPRTMMVAEHRVTWWNRMRPWDAHCIVRLLRAPTWTLLWIGRTRRTWGFLEPSLWPSMNHVPDGDGGTVQDGAWRASGGVWRWTEHTAFDSGHVLGGEQ